MFHVSGFMFYENMIPLPKAPKIISRKGNTAIFEIQGLYPGFGTTIGNSLRRILLSSLGGAAITQVKIKGVNHEFSTIPGVLEDVVLIMLNLKKLRFKSYSDEPEIATLKVKGNKKVYGKDFKLSSQLEISNTDTHIATITKNSTELDIEVKVEKGIGYSPIESREDRKAEIGVMPIDAIFTPVRKVSFRVENMRVGKRTDFDKLIVELETESTIKPEEAISQAADILVSHFSLISEIGKKVEKEKEKKEDKPKKKKPAKTKKKVKGLSKTTRRSPVRNQDF